MLNQCQYLKRLMKPSLAYHQHIGEKALGVIFLSGFMSDMNGTKATALERWCRSEKCSFIRFDYSGIGLSKGDITDVKDWIEDAVEIFTSLTTGPQVVIGSSMGAYIMLHLCQRITSNRLAGMLAIAPSFDFPNKIIKWRENSIPENGFRTVTSPYGSWTVPESFFDLGVLNEIVRFDEINKYELICPFHIFQGMQDEVIPWQSVVHFVTNCLRDSNYDVSVTMQKNGYHRMSEPNDVRRLLHLLKLFLEKGYCTAL